MDRFSAIELAAAGGDDALSWREELMVHGPRVLPMRLMPGTLESTRS